MKICPECQAEVEEQFDLCWKRNYSSSAGKVAEIQDEGELIKRMNENLNR